MTEHETKYEKLAQFIGVESLKSIVHGFGIEPKRWAELLAEDEHLNNVQLAKWDARDGQVRSLVAGAIGRARQQMGGFEPGFQGTFHVPHNPSGFKFSWSLGETVCLLKHVARFHVAKAEGAQS